MLDYRNNLFVRTYYIIYRVNFNLAKMLYRKGHKWI